MTAVDPYLRATRLSRGARDVLKHYALTRAQAPASDRTLVRVGVTKSRKTRYVVILRSDWSAPPSCDCPDHEQRSRELRGFCKHVVAVCLTYEDLRCQLLDLLL